MADQYTSKRSFYEKRKGALEIERSSFIAHWKELAEYILPRRGRFFVGEQNRGDNRRYRAIINSRATQAAKISRAGMVSGVMSPSRKWFNLATANQAFMEIQEVRIWLDEVYKIMNNVFNKGNLFTMAPVMIAELILFGTGAMSHVDDDQDVARFYAHPIGSYVIGQNDRGEVDTFIRDFQMTVGQLVDKFGIDNVSVSVKNMYQSGKIDAWGTVCHYVGPNSTEDTTRADSKYKKYASIYWELGCSEPDKFLSEMGFDEFPVYVPRWDLTGEDIWGTDCPGMVALGDVKQLQLEERRKAQAIDKMVNPPLKGPASLKNVPVSSLPGGITIYDQDGTKEGLSPIYQVEPRLIELNEDIQGIERRINEAFYVDLFFAITQMQGIQPRNQLELSQRNQERLLQLGPVLERIQNEFLSKMIERTFNQLVRKNLLPPAPDAIRGQPLEVKFVSSLAMAQRSEQITAINDLRLFVSELAQSGYPEAVDKFDSDQSIDELSIITGVPPTLVRSDEQVASIRQERAQRQQDAAVQQQQAALTEQLVNVTRR